MPSVRTAGTSPEFNQHLCSAQMGEIPVSGRQSGSWPHDRVWSTACYLIRSGLMKERVRLNGLVQLLVVYR